MKIELGKKKPDVLKEEWPGEYTTFSWMEYVTAIPQPLFLITTYKENGKLNANIQRDKVFCINFPDQKNLKKCYDTIHNNEYEKDEIVESGFTFEKAYSLEAPRIKECFMNLECKFEWEKELFLGSEWILICGSIQHIGLNEDFAKADAVKRFKDYGIMYNIHAPNNPIC